MRSHVASSQRLLLADFFLSPLPALGRKLPVATGSNRPIVLKKSVLQTARALTPENVFFARSYAKSEPGILCSK